MGNIDSVNETLSNCCCCEKEESAPVGVYIPTYPTYHNDSQFAATPSPGPTAREPIELVCPPTADRLAVAEVPTFEEFGSAPPAPFPGHPQGLPQGLPPGPPPAQFSSSRDEIDGQEASSKAPEASPESTRASSEEAQTERSKTNDTQAAASKSSPRPNKSPRTSSGAGRLPPGWQECISKSSGKIYFYNRATGESTFVAPKFDDSADYATLPPGWVEMTSKSTGKVYYWNATLQKSQFERPTEPA